MVEARYICENCETRFSLQTEATAAATEPRKCESCGGRAKLIEFFDAMGHNPPSVGDFLVAELIFWLVLIGVGASAGVASLCR